jgi:signal transduction histidine kinase
MATPPPLRTQQRNDKEFLEPEKARNQALTIAIRVVVAIGITLVITALRFDYIESFFYDLRVHYRLEPNPSGHIEIILVDAKTIQTYKTIPGFKEHAQVLQKLASGSSPSAVVYTRAFAALANDPTNSHRGEGGLLGTRQDELDFVHAASSLKNFYMQSDSLARAAEEKKLELVRPFQNLAVGSGPKTSDRTILARDSVSRRVMISYQGQVLLHPKLAALFNPVVANLDQIRGREVLFDSEQVYIDFVSPGAFSTTKFEDVLGGKIDLHKFDGKLVLIGDDIGAASRDYVSTPFNHDATMTVTELHANMFDTLIRNSAPVQRPPWWDVVLTFIIAFLTLSVSLSMRPTKGILILIGGASVFALIAWIEFSFFGWWLNMAHPLLAIFVCYYFFIPYRLILENRRSWEYYQRHKLLQQVEELKTNFISMMSHDLKTPIARIQGMTDVIARDKVILSHQQQEAVDTIRSSSTDLLGFIDSILNYARIENQGVQLHMQAKDINQLIEEVVRKHEFLAKVKHISLSSELEPLFSISVDPDLIKQVFSNLLENAIKYSSEGGAVAVRSREADGFVTVEFIDNGPGIPQDEQANVFMKFFRSKNVKSSPVKGSGLGLYLARYFVELHNGTIFVTSTPGKGSTFTVKLPLKQ